MDPSSPTADGSVTGDLEAASDRLRAVAGRRRRSLAWLVDYLVVMVPGLTLVFFVANYLMTDVYGLGGAVVARAVQWFTHRRTFGLGEAAFNEWVNFALPLVLALLAVPLAQFGYQGIMLGWRGRTSGADRARELGGRAADRARSLGGTARGLWRQRREGRAELPAAPEAAAMIEEAAEPEH